MNTLSVSFRSLVLIIACALKMSAAQAQTDVSREVPASVQTPPQPPATCQYYVEGLECSYLLKQLGKPTSWKFGEDKKYWTCSIEVPVIQDSENVSCNYSVKAPCHKEQAPSEIAQLACILDPICSGRPFVYDYFFEVQLKNEMSKEVAEALCKNAFMKMSTEVGGFHDRYMRFHAVLPGSGVSCEGPCTGYAAAKTCDQGQPSYSTTPVCKVSYSEKPTAKAGHFHFGDSDDVKKAYCTYHRDCLDFSLQNTLSSISGKTGRMCSVFGLPSWEDASTSYQKFCSMTEETWKKSPEKTHLILFPTVYDYSVRHNIKPPESGAWSWKQYREWASTDCDAVKNDKFKQQAWESKAFEECKTMLEKIEKWEAKAGKIPSATMACCEYSITE